jgi:hypothetical protein
MKGLWADWTGFSSWACLARRFAETGLLQPANPVYHAGVGGVRFRSPLDFAQFQSGVAEP